jgi:DNA-directed RNA polymerase subunit RPC12/RpoP
MKATWKKIILTSGESSPNCKCLPCGKEFTFLGEGHFNMRLIKCPTCKQEVWVPRCPNGCSSFKDETK